MSFIEVIGVLLIPAIVVMSVIEAKMSIRSAKR